MRKLAWFRNVPPPLPGGAYAAPTRKEASDIAAAPAAAVVQAAHAKRGTPRTRPISIQASIPQRIVARLMDLYIQSSLLFVALMISPGSGRLPALGTSEVPSPFLVMLWLPAAFVLEAIFAAIFGNSPGKALVGIRVVRLNGSRPLCGDYLTRGLQLWTSGFGLGVPLINLCTGAWQLIRLGKDLAATYDEGWYMVSTSGAAPWRTVLVALVFVAFAGLLTAWGFHA